MSVKRYQPVVQCVEPSYQAQMIEPKVMEFSEGEYVLHSDYAALCKAVIAVDNRNAALLAKVERLTKAAIAMGMALPDTDEANAAYSTFERVVRS